MDPEPSWNWPPGHELAPGLLAWALLGDGRRCETWLAWDLGRWCPVAVKLPRPGRPARAVAALAQEAHGNAYHFLVRQVVWAAVGLITAFLSGHLHLPNVPVAIAMFWIKSPGLSVGCAGGLASSPM